MSAPNPSGLSSAHRIRARDLAIQAALLGLHNAPAIHYTQGAKRWQGIDNHLKSWRGEYPKYADCSAFTTWCLWNGLDHFHVRDVVNGAAWKSGYTGTQLDHGERIDGRFKPQRADLVLYGTGYPGHHVAIVIGRRKADGKLMVVSHGSEGGPYFLPFDYRSDVMQLRRYI